MHMSLKHPKTISFLALFFLIFNISAYFLFWFFLSESILFFTGAINIFLCIISVVSFFSLQSSYQAKKRDKVFLLFIYIFFIVGTFLFHQERLETGHDPGSYMWFAARISRTNSFNPTDETTATSFHYFYQGEKIVFQNKEIWPFILATFYKILWTKWFSLCIILLHTFGLFFITQVWLDFLGTKKKNILLFLCIFLFSYYDVYYTRSGYIENILFFQSWWAIYYFLKFINFNGKYSLILSFIYIISIYLTRPEASFYLIGFLLAYFIFLFRSYKIRLSYVSPIIFWLTILAYLIDLFFFDSFIINGFKKLTVSMSSSESGVYTEYNRFILILFFSINTQIISLAIFGYLSIFKRTNVSINIFYILILFLPQLFFLILPTIQLVLPWAYRRYWVGIFSLGFLLLFTLKNHPLYRNKISIILLCCISLFNGGKIFWMFSWEDSQSGISKINYFLQNNIDTSKTWLISMDYSANYVYILSDYYGWPIFVDQTPLKKIEIYDYFFNKKEDVLIFTFINKIKTIREFYNEKLNINVKPEDIQLETVFPLNVNRIGSFFDVNSLFNFRRLFLWYGQVMREGQILFEQSATPFHSNIYVYRLKVKKYFLPLNSQYWDFDKNLNKVILPEIPYSTLRL